MPEPASQPSRRLLRGLAALAAAGALVSLLVLLVGRVASDRWAWSQPLFWIPGFAPVLAAAVLGAGSMLMARSARWRGGRRLAAGVLIAAAAGSVWVVWFEWRAPNVLLRPAAPDGLRIIAWNATDVSPEAFEAAVGAQRPDIVIAINPPLRLDWPELASRLWDLPRGRAMLHMRASGSVVIASRFTPVGSGGTGLGFAAPVAGAEEPLLDTGRAAFATLDLPGRRLVVWAIDLPSDPSLSRSAAAQQARRVIDSASFQGYQLSEDGRYFVAAPPQGFPAPDVLVGDFNTTRGAVSLAPLTRGLRDAHALAGVGPDATWPRGFALLGLDQAFVRRSVGLARYDVVDPGVGTHLMQRLQLAPWAGLSEGR